MITRQELNQFARREPSTLAKLPDEFLWRKVPVQNRQTSAAWPELKRIEMCTQPSKVLVAERPRVFQSLFLQPCPLRIDSAGIPVRRELADHSSKFWSPLFIGQAHVGFMRPYRAVTVAVEPPADKP